MAQSTLRKNVLLVSLVLYNPGWLPSVCKSPYWDDNEVHAVGLDASPAC